MSSEHDTSGPTGPSSSPSGERPGGRMAFGLVLLALGVVFALHQLGVGTTERWWTILILIPAGGALVAATRFYRAASGWTAPAIGALTGGVLLLALWAKLFFGGFWHGGFGYHALATHAGMWHGPFFAGHLLLPIIAIAVIFALLARRRHWHG